MDGGAFDLGAFPAPDAANGFAQKKKKKKSKKNDPFGFDDGGESAPDDTLQQTSSSRRVSFSDEAMGRPIEEFAGGFGNSPTSGFPGGTSGPSPGGYSSPSSLGPSSFTGPFHEGGSSFSGGIPLDRFEESEFSRARGDSMGGAAAPPSAIDQALSRAAESRSLADSLTEPSRPQAASAPAAQSGPGFAQASFGAGGQRPFGEDFGGPRRVQRGFSFSLNDMPDNAVIAGESPFYVGAHPPIRDHMTQAQKWNPLDGISRHWAETAREALEMPSIGVAGKGAGGLGALPSSFLKPGSLEEELAAAERRVKALHSRLFELESNAPSSAAAPVAQGHLKITVPRPLDNGKLGVAVKDMTVVSIVDPRAMQHSWSVGDRILQVNGIPVCFMQEFANELNKALAANQASGKPLVFDIWRHAAPAGPTQPATAALPAPAGDFASAPPATLPLSDRTEQPAVAAAAHSATAPARPRSRRAVCGECMGSDSEHKSAVHHHRGAAQAGRSATPPPRSATPPPSWPAGSAVPLATPIPGTHPPVGVAAPAPGIPGHIGLPVPMATQMAGSAVPLALPAPAPMPGPPRTLLPSEYAPPTAAPMHAAGPAPSLSGGAGHPAVPSSRAPTAHGAPLALGMGPAAAMPGGGSPWVTQPHAADLPGTMRLPGPPATAPVRGSNYPPMGFTKDMALPSTVTTLPMPGHPAANGYHDPMATTMHPHHHNAAADSRRRHLVC